MPKSNHFFSQKMNPHNFWRGLNLDSASTMQGLSWHQPLPVPQYSTTYMMSLEDQTQMEMHSNPPLHFAPAAEEVLAINGSVAMGEYHEVAGGNKKRKADELGKRSTCERKRRSRIAERMKTLQELVLPNCSYKLSAASVLDKTIECIKALQLQKASLSYQQMMMDGLLIPTHNFPGESANWDNSSDSILMANCDSTAINPFTHPGLSYHSDGLFSPVTRSMLHSELRLQLLQSPPPPMPIPAPLYDGYLASASSSSPSSQSVSLSVELVSSPRDNMF